MAGDLLASRVGVIGAGSWGTSLAVLLAGQGASVSLWGHDPAKIAAIKSSRVNAAYLPEVSLPPAINPTTSLADLLDAGVILFVTPSKAVRHVAGEFASLNPSPETVFVSCTKGIEHGTGLRMTQIISELFPRNRVATLSGPNHATEVARRMPTAAVLGSQSEEVAGVLQRLFSSKYFRIYTSDDVAGIELGGALKNIFAISAGVSDGLGLGDNSKAALVTRSLAELNRLGTALGGRRETFQGLSGIGDLMVTCFSSHSRNRRVGERLGRGESLAEIARSMNMVAEGVPTALGAFECARKLRVETPIIDQVHAVLYGGKSPKAALMELLSRDPRPEEDRLAACATPSERKIS